MSEHHNLDVAPVPEKVLYINETGIADESTYDLLKGKKDMDEEDNVRIYIPLDLNQSAILRRLNETGYRMEEPTEANECSYSSEVSKIISQLEIYDQVWFVREGISPKEPGEH